MYCKRALAAAVFLLAACQRSPRPVERTAILSFENLSGEPALDWMGRALAEVIGGQLASSARVYVIPLENLHTLDAALGRHSAGAPGISAERPLAVAAGCTRIVYGTFSRHDGRLRVEAAAGDPDTNRVVRWLSAEGPDVFTCAAAVARSLDPAARAFGTRNPGALRDYTLAEENGDAEAAERAVARDPGFGQAWLLRARIALWREGAAGGARVLERASQQALAPLERAQVNYGLATFRGDGDGRARALTDLQRLAPADPANYRNLADMALDAHQYGQAAGHLRTAAQRHPSDPSLWNLLGYAEAYAGDLDAATAALRTYERLRPREANPLDSLGDVRLYLGRPLDAERDYLAAFALDPAFLEAGTLYKAAWARLYSGDVAGATRTFERYAGARPNDPLLDFRRAEWSWLAGRRREAA
ncbi:MAG TPA: hypothetical protein VF832_03830, partial [Longimicrobiales bacterium]